MTIKFENHVIMTHIDDETVLLNINNGKYYCLNKTSVRIWDLLQQHKNAEEIHAVILEEYDVPHDVLLRDIQNLISSLVNAELLTLK